MKKLQDWQDRTGTGDEALAKLAGVQRSTIQRAKRGLNILSMKTQRSIKQITDGQVTPADWAEHYEASAVLASESSDSAEEDLHAAGAM